MKGEKWFSALEGTVLSFFIAFGGCACLATGFRMPVELGRLALVCGAFSLLFSLCTAFRLWPVTLCALAGTAGYLWWEDRYLKAVEVTANYISRVYDRAYHSGVVAWSPELPGEEFLTTGLCMLGILSALLIALVVCRRGRAYFACLTALTPLTLCVVVTDTVPQAPYLFLLLLGTLLILMTQPSRRGERSQGIRLTWYLIAPVAIALGLLFLAVPKESYSGQEYGDKALEALQKWGSTFTPTIPGQSLGLEFSETGSSQVDLSEIGPKGNQFAPVMTVTVPRDGQLYLRGVSFDRYDGHTWSHEDPDGEESWTMALNEVGLVQVTTRQVHPIVYFPYYPMELGPNFLKAGAIPNTENQKSYSILQGELAGDWPWTFDGLDPACMELPESTQEWAQTYLDQAMVADPTFWENLGTWDVTDLAEWIGGLVRRSAQYDLSTPQMPQDREDFARWFLEESDTGYCVHYATAATVLLRAVGIPARYVTGYLVTAQGGRDTTVLEKNAHAWVEYFTPAGWRVLESTPGMEVEPSASQPPTSQPPTSQPTPSESTAPPADLPTTLPTTQTLPEGTRPTSTNAPGRDDPAKKPFTLPKWVGQLLWALLGVAAVCAGLLGQWRLRLELRRRRERQGPPNRQALARWRGAERYARLLKESPPRELRELAQKAKYSQHTLTREELARFDEYGREARTRLRRRPWYRQLVDRLVFAAY